MKAFGPEAGTIIGGIYRVVRHLGSGAMGVVLLANDETLERRVAIKLINPARLDHDELKDRFVFEARAMARVSHRHVVPIYAFGQHEGSPYFVMEFVEGQTLEEWLHPDAKLHQPDLDLAIRVLDETCQGVAAIHAADTLHRDLKPSNVLLDRQFHVRVADLGVADLLRRAGAPGSAQVVGTPAYMAPELAFERDLAPELLHRADVYSLGCIAYEVFTGRRPFEAEGAAALMFMHATAVPAPPSELRADLPPEFDRAVLRALAKKPADRTPTVETFRRDLLAAYDRRSEPVRILVAEDDEDFRDALAIALKKEFPDAAIECFADGASALQAFDRQPHSVAILDLQMPGLDGIELTGLLRARDSAHAMPIIVVTASGGPSEWKRLSAMGADGFLVKPVNLKDLVTLVRRTLGERSQSSVRPPA